jgi:hypothetical protein
VQIRTYRTAVTIGNSGARISGTNRYYDGVSNTHCKSALCVLFARARRPFSNKIPPSAMIKVQSVERESNLIKSPRESRESRAMLITQHTVRSFEGAFSTRATGNQAKTLPRTSTASNRELFAPCFLASPHAICFQGEGACWCVGGCC